MFEPMNTKSHKARSKNAPVYPSVGRVLMKLGADISLARRARKISVDDFAASMGVSRSTLHRLEKGDAGVSLNTLASALNSLGRLDLLENIINQTKDDVALMLLRQKIPQRVVGKRRKKAQNMALENNEDEQKPHENTELAGW